MEIKAKSIIDNLTAKVLETKQKQFYEGKVHKYHIQYSRCRQSKIKDSKIFRLAETYVIKKGGFIL